MRLVAAVFATVVATSLWGCSQRDDPDVANEDEAESEGDDAERPVTTRSNCKHNVGVYSWDQRNWREPENSELLRFLASGEVCGDVYVNIADYSSARYLKDERKLVMFLRAVRKTGAAGVVYLTYGDVTEKDERAVEDFVDTFFRWTRSLSKVDVRSVAPLGVSFDIEHFPARTFERVLTKANKAKKQLIAANQGWRADDIIIQSTIEGAYKPVDTDIIMRLADRALMMVYRNSLATDTANAAGDNDLLDRLRWFLTEQCQKCLDDEYAISHYRAKLSIMVETACRVGNSCKSISFCAKTTDVLPHQDPADLVFSTLTQFDQRILSSGLVTTDQVNRLFVPDSPKESRFVVHHFEWFRCYFRNGSGGGLCENFDVWAETCRSQ
jgi:hypothetical protein